MLIESFKLNDVVTLKLVGGDEIIGRLADERMSDYVELTKPQLVMMGQQGFGLVPYVLTANPEAAIKVEKAHIIATTKTFEGVAKEYLKQTTGLIV